MLPINKYQSLLFLFEIPNFKTLSSHETKLDAVCAEMFVFPTRASGIFLGTLYQKLWSPTKKKENVERLSRKG